MAITIAGKLLEPFLQRHFTIYRYGKINCVVPPQHLLVLKITFSKVEVCKNQTVLKMCLWTWPQIVLRILWNFFWVLLISRDDLGIMSRWVTYTKPCNANRIGFGPVMVKVSYPYLLKSRYNLTGSQLPDSLYGTFEIRVFFVLFCFVLFCFLI